MECLLMRHADAIPGEEDLLRPLSEKGKRQAQLAAEWLQKSLPDNTRVLVSPATRAQQTAAFLSRDFITLPELTPDLPTEKVIKAINLKEGVTLVIAHQPALSEVAIKFLNNLDALSWTATCGSICHIEWVNEPDHEPRARLKALFYPE